MNCRFCGTKLEHVFIDLGTSPPSNSFLKKSELKEPEIYYPLKAMVCHNCFLVQVDEVKKHNEIFNDKYAYFSSFSTTWLNHAKCYTEMITNKLNLGNESLVLEIASNDGYLLKNFVDRNIPCVGIEPTTNTANIAIEKGVPTITSFFNHDFAIRFVSENKKADLIIANNVIAHDPDLNSLIAGMSIALGNLGVITIEFPHLLNLIKCTQFDTIYHEHFSYYSLFTLEKILKKHNIKIFDVEKLSTHGGSLRVFACHNSCEKYLCTDKVNSVIHEELTFGINKIFTYLDFEKKAIKLRNNFLSFVINSKEKGKTIVGYGAAAKGNTFLNYCGLHQDVVDFVVDASPYKRGTFMPGSRIPVVGEDAIKENQPDYILVLPWNLKSEIINQLEYIREWGGKFVIAIPELEIL